MAKIDKEFAAEYIRGILEFGDDSTHIPVADIRRAFEMFALPPAIEKDGYAFISGRNASWSAIRTATRRTKAIEELKQVHADESAEASRVAGLREEFIFAWGHVRTLPISGIPERKMRILWSALSGRMLKDIAIDEGISQDMAQKEAQRGRQILTDIGASDGLINQTRRKGQAGGDNG